MHMFVAMYVYTSICLWVYVCTYVRMYVCKGIVELRTYFITIEVLSLQTIM